MSEDTLCPHCGTNIPEATSPTDEEASPAAGDLSMCIYCGGWAEFQEDGTLYPLAPDDERHKDEAVMALTSAYNIMNEQREYK